MPLYGLVLNPRGALCVDLRDDLGKGAVAAFGGGLPWVGGRRRRVSTKRITPPAHTDQPACPQRIPGSGGGCRTLGSYRGGRFGRPSPRCLKKVSTRAEARGAESGGGGGAALAAAAAGSGAVAAPSSSEKTSSSSPRVRRSATFQLRMAASTSPKARGRSRRSGSAVPPKKRLG